ncbi:uncharacterized protein SPPG_00832 [Spizellomyces punctatus DAOM BR117]|uniref:Uncharacterized protein n=1 Tax=Spizellomyces punctatus (strain DAOM BR117) TaxID=645134 RepID=A0A0L0HWA6_SPIPD|nr:uncharacterized protein SPPG_00832 [Spizellomyces punctatus DAOM BR117]KND05164.1 hypothetical protein SPPG_00832 [Spizellomyces punctatus DAOM BR117]|eukprot:XP_016613203.1 hypothetical protein SPPG_00832 [Spizellomyces punctatus DAOM BR117]
MDTARRRISLLSRTITPPTRGLHNAPDLKEQTSFGQEAGPFVPTVSRTELDPVNFLRRSANVYPNKIAVWHESRSYAYSILATRVLNYAASLLRLGIRKGDRVAVLLPNIPAMLESHFAVPLTGAILVTINTRLNKDEVGYILRDCGARILVVDHELLDLVGGDQARTGNLEHIVRVDDTGSDIDPYEQFIYSSAKNTLDRPPCWTDFPSRSDERETISINYTSGTTGRPKGVMYHSRGAYLNALSECLEMGMSSESVYLWTLPMFHCNGWCFPWATVAAGATNVMLRKIDYAQIWTLLTTLNVSHYCGAPTVHTSIIHHPAARRLPQQVKCMIAAAPPSPTMIAKMMELNFVPVHVYGLTETYGPITICAWQSHWKTLTPVEQAALLSRQGQNYTVADEVRIVDENMNDTPWDGETMGEVVMRGNNVMTGYYNDSVGTAKAFQGGYFHSGDLGVRHPDGYIELRDRAKDIIISGGENISTILLENTILAHSSVFECAVVSSPHDKWGEVPVAYVVLKPDASIPIDRIPDEIVQWCKQTLAGFQVPKGVKVLKELPRTSTGKVRKTVLRDMEWSGKTKRIQG